MLRSRLVRLTLVIFLVALLGVGFGVSFWPARPRPVAVRVTPSELFVGDLERIKPHLDLADSAYFTVEVSGGPPPPPMTLRERLDAILQRGDFLGPRAPCPVIIEEITEFWKDGKPSGENSSIPGGASWRFPFSVSLKEEFDEKGERVYRLITARSNGRTTQRAPAPKLRHGTWSREVIEGPVALPLDEPVAVWAYLADEMTPGDSEGSWSYSPAGGTIENQAKSVAWAVVVKLRARDRQALTRARLGPPPAAPTP
jgi:hypothetical protein